MTNKEFFQWIASDGSGVYTQFNKLRDSLFLELSHIQKFPRKYSELVDVLTEINDPSITEVISSEFNVGDGFVYCKAEPFTNFIIHYFVNTTKSDADGPIARHWQLIDHNEDDNSVYSSIVLIYEKHPSLRPVEYPKVIKHELVHAAIESKLVGQENFDFYWSEDKEISDFIEFVCSIVPYLSTPVKKENGVSKFEDDMKVVFGYNPDDEKIQGYLKIVNEIVNG